MIYHMLAQPPFGPQRTAPAARRIDSAVASRSTVTLVTPASLSARARVRSRERLPTCLPDERSTSKYYS